MLARLLPTIQLTRLTMAFGAVSDLWFAIVLSRGTAALGGAPSAPAQMPLAVALVLGAIVAVGLFAFAASLNDLLDVRHDMAFSPDRPIPAGRIRVGQAIVVVVGSLLIAMSAAVAFGESALLLAAVTAGATLFYNSAAKFIPALGFLTVALIHSTHMLIPDHAQSFTVPIWLIATHALVISAAVHHLDEKRPALTRRAALFAAVGYLVGTTALFGLGAARAGVPGGVPESLHPIGFAWPLLAVIGFVVVARHKIRAVPGGVGAEKLRRYGAMWHSLYAAAWLAALGRDGPALCFGLLALVGFAAMTAIKEVNGLTGRPLEFRG